MNTIFVGYDPREDKEYQVCIHSIKKRAKKHVRIIPVEMGKLQQMGVYKRPMHYEEGLLIDEISGFPMATSHAISRFFVPYLANQYCPDQKWVLFMDADMIVNCDINDIFTYTDDSKAIVCTQHQHNTGDIDKMDGQLQHFYNRKNWSSMMLFNLDHPENTKLTLDLLNTVPGRDLHAFCWLEEKFIGKLPLTYNALVDYNTSTDKTEKIYHYTLGTPLMEGYENCMHSDKFFKELEDYEAR